MIDVWQYSEYALDSEYATVLNMLGSHKVVNKIFHDKHLTGFWICLQFWKYQCYAGFCRKQPVIHVWQVSEYSVGSQCYRVWINTVVNMLRLQSSWVLNMLNFWMYQKSKDAILQGSELNISSYIFGRVLNIPRFQNISEFWIY